MGRSEVRLSESALDVPRLHRYRYRPSAHKVLDGLAQVIGTGRFIAAQTVVFVAWIGINVFVPGWRWDYSQPYPLILLTLIISAQAAYAAPLILLNQNRQTDLDRVRAQRDRDGATQDAAATRYIIAELTTLRGAIDKAMTRDTARQELSDLRGRIDSLATSLRDEPRPRQSAVAAEADTDT